MNKDEKIDVLYVLHNRVHLGNLDHLRFSLRSIDKNLYNIGNVYVVGNDISSKFNSSLINIVNESMAMRRTTNEFKYIHTFANLDSVSNNFLLFDEKNFLCAGYNAHSMPFCSHTKVLKEEETDYMDNTYKFLRKNRLTLSNFHNHAPMIFNKKRIKEMFAELEFPTNNICIKTIYANFFKKKFDFFVPLVFDNNNTDKEIATALINKRKMFSVDGDILRVNMNHILYLMYPNKSKWEL